MSSGRLFTAGGAAVPGLGRFGHRDSGDPPFSVCMVCRGPARVGCEVCWSCHEVQTRLGRTIPVVVPMAMTAAGTTAHRLVVGYKAAISTELRAHASGVLSATFGSWLERHVPCLLGDRVPTAPVVLVPVPSTAGGRPSWRGRHPLLGVCEGACAAVAADSSRAPSTAPPIRTLALLRPSETPPSRLRPRADGFVVVDDGASLAASLIVVDDIWTSGARAVSAAAALGAAGFDVLAIVPFTRFVRPTHNAATTSYWADVSRQPASVDHCAVCDRDTIGRDVSGPSGVAVPGTTRMRAARPGRPRSYELPVRRVVERLAAA